MSSISNNAGIDIRLKSNYIMLLILIFPKLKKFSYINCCVDDDNIRYALTELLTYDRWIVKKSERNIRYEYVM